MVVMALAKGGLEAFTRIERHAGGHPVTDDEINALDARSKNAAQAFRDAVKAGQA